MLLVRSNMIYPKLKDSDRHPVIKMDSILNSIFMTVDRKLGLLRQRREKLERVKRGLMKDLLSGRRRVKLTG